MNPTTSPLPGPPNHRRLGMTHHQARRTPAGQVAGSIVTSLLTNRQLIHHQRCGYHRHYQQTGSRSNAARTMGANGPSAQKDPDRGEIGLTAVGPAAGVGVGVIAAGGRSAVNAVDKQAGAGQGRTCWSAVISGKWRNWDYLRATPIGSSPSGVRRTTRRPNAFNENHAYASFGPAGRLASNWSPPATDVGAASGPFKPYPTSLPQKHRTRSAAPAVPGDP